jgi:pimeloyl-ACP methyl ester carboxylesterase
MPYLHVGEENSGGIELYYEDQGQGSPVLLIHGWPLSGASWEKQVTALLAAGYRVVTYDRRGFGRSAQPSSGYDYDTLALDLHQVITKLELRKAALVGFSMGAGEVARYLGRYGCERVSRAVFIAGITPYLRGGPENLEGVPEAVFDGIRKAILTDRPAFLSGFLADFYNLDLLGGKRISSQAVQYSWNVAVAASPKATLDCVGAWGADFRKDLARLEVPSLVIHGDADRILPIEATGIRTHQAVRGSHLVVVGGAPHGLLWTHAENVNHELLQFLAKGQ